MALIGSLYVSVERVIGYIVTNTTGSERKTVIGRKVIIICFEEIKVLNLTTQVELEATRGKVKDIFAIVCIHSWIVTYVNDPL